MTYSYIIITFLLLLCGVLGFYCIKFALIVLKVQDVLEESIDVMDKKYQTISEVLKRPLFFDSPEVRSVLNEIKDTQQALHEIAIALSKDFQPEKESDGKIDER